MCHADKEILRLQAQKKLKSIADFPTLNSLSTRILEPMALYHQ